MFDRKRGNCRGWLLVRLIRDGGVRPIFGEERGDCRGWGKYGIRLKNEEKQRG